MNAPFEFADKIFQNACNFRIQYHLIPDHPPVEELLKETGRWFSELKDEDDESFRNIRMKIWQLRAHVIYSLRPFDSDELRIEEQLLSLQHDAIYFPAFQERMKRLTKIIDFLLVNPINPKRLKVFELLQLYARNGLRTGIVLALTRGSTPGWSKTLAEEITQIAPDCEFILGCKTLKLNDYQRIILPANGRFSPLINDLYHGCHAEKLDVVVYKREGVYTPRKKLLPKGNFVKRGRLNILPDSQPHEEESAETYLDEWAQRRFWEALRENIQTGVSSIIPGREFLIKARIVILTNNTKVFLREDMKIIEISDLVEGQPDIETYRKRYPRRRVDELKEGDLIVLRTSGSGEYLVDFANALMEADGKKNLLNTALDWKPLLRQALLSHGSEKIADLLKARGHILANHHYIWIWTTDLVIRPQKQSLFQDLINILNSLGYRLEEGSPFEAATRRWKKMKEIIRYHAQAGQKIRRALLERLEKMIQEHVIITDSYHLSLPGLSAGEISVFRVAAVDNQGIEIPYHHAGVITPLEP